MFGIRPATLMAQSIAPRLMHYASTVVCAAVLASTPALAQQVARSGSQVQSVVSLAPSPHPVGQFLARRPTDATFEKAPASYHIFTAADMGEEAGVENLTLNFSGETTLTSLKISNRDFVVEPGGTCYEGNHFSRGESCTVLVRFTPQGPGHRLSFLKITNSADAAPATIGLAGNAYAPVLSFTPAVISTVPVTVSSGVGIVKSSKNMTIDGGDILYIADIGNNRIREIDSSGTMTNISPAFATPASLAADSVGILYSANVPGSTYYFSTYAPWGVQTAYGYTYAAGNCTPSTPCPFSSVGMNLPANVSMDAYDNLFFEEGTKGAAEMPVAGVGAGACCLNLWYLKDQFSYANNPPGSFAVDAGGNLYNNYTYTPNNLCILIFESLYDAEYAPSATRVAGGTQCGFSGDGGRAAGAEISSAIGEIAFDAANNLYFADAGNQRVRRIDYSTGIIRTIAGTGTNANNGDGGPATKAALASPMGVAVDSQGQVYILAGSASTGTAQLVRKVGTTGAVVFGSRTVNTASAALTVNVANTGNSALTLTSSAMTGTNPGDFKVDSTTTSCNLAPGATLNAGQSCQIGIIFTPAAVGSRSAFLTLLDNTVNSINNIRLTGSGLAAAVVNFVSPLSNASFSTTSSVTVKVQVTSSNTTVPTGTVTFKVDGIKVGSATLVSGTASTSLSGLSAGSHTLYVAYSGDKYNSSAHASETISITGAAAASAAAPAFQTAGEELNHGSGERSLRSEE